MVIRNTSSFLHRRKLGTFTTVRYWFPFLFLYLINSFKEPNNLRNRNTFRLNGLIHPKVVGVEAVSDGKGVVFSTGSAKSMKEFSSFFSFILIIKYSDIKKPAKRFHKVKLTKDSRRTLTSIRRTIRKQHYRKDLKMVCFISMIIICYNKSFFRRLFVEHLHYFVVND